MFTKQFEVRYYEVDKRQQSTPVAILNYLEEAAVAHSETVGCGLERLKSEGTGWVLNRWHLEMERYPRWSEQVQIETWPSSFERFYATREFVIRDSSKNVIGKASTLWVFISLTKKRPMRIPMEFYQAYGLNSERAVDSLFPDLPAMQNPQFTKEFWVRRSDIDTNEHVNNAKYVEWILESVPSEIYDTSRLKSLEVVYKRESGYGSAVVSQCEQAPETLELWHRVSGQGSEAELALARTVWTPI